MQASSVILFYVFFCSAVLVYGVGILPAAEASLSRRPVFLSALKSFFCVLSTVTLVFLLRQRLLFPLGLSELFPLAALLIFVSISVFYEIIAQLTSKKSSAEFAFPYLAILLSLCECSSLAEAVLISVATLTAYYLFIPFLRAFVNRTATLKNTDAYRQKVSLFLCMAVFMLALYSLDVSWLKVAFWGDGV